MKVVSNSVLIEKLKSSNSKENEEAMEYLYTILYKKVLGYILNNKGQEEEAKDIFQDGLLAFFKLIKRNKITTETKVEAYVFSICRNLWLKKLKKKKKESDQPIENFDLAIEDVLSDQIFSVDKSNLLERVLKEIGSGCQTILFAFYYERQSMQEIMQSMNLSSIQVAKNKKFKCLQRLKKIVLNSDYYKNNLRG